MPAGNRTLLVAGWVGGFCRWITACIAVRSRCLATASGFPMAPMERCTTLHPPSHHHLNLTTCARRRCGEAPDPSGYVQTRALSSSSRRVQVPNLHGHTTQVSAAAVACAPGRQQRYRAAARMSKSMFFSIRSRRCSSRQRRSSGRRIRRESCYLPRCVHAWRQSSAVATPPPARH